jgi:uncharacterized integral membrane protein
MCTNHTIFQINLVVLNGIFCVLYQCFIWLSIFERIIDILTAVGLTPGGSSTVHIYTQTIHRTTQLTTLVGRLSGIRTQSGHTKINVELTT